MKTSNNRIILDDAIRYSPTNIGVDFTDETNTNFHIPMKLLVRLYEGAKHCHTKKSGDWESFCNSLFI